ncbi:MAG: hypothetical protein FD167_3990 [bacterium]|nr:MAG: hypothetical protein FD167_3990 [bacterium]
MVISSKTLLQTVRESIVLEHMDSEDKHEFNRTLATFSQPRYEVIPTGQIYEGSEPVLKFLQETYIAFPDFHFELLKLRHTEDAIIVEVKFIGTQEGYWRGLPPTGRKIIYQMQNIFLFEEDKLMCERLYFDQLTIMKQLSIAYEPTSTPGIITTAIIHPITISLAMFRAFMTTKPKS